MYYKEPNKYAPYPDGVVNLARDSSGEDLPGCSLLTSHCSLM